jgi:hypothetical protein
MTIADTIAIDAAAIQRGLQSGHLSKPRLPRCSCMTALFGQLDDKRGIWAACNAPLPGSDWVGGVKAWLPLATVVRRERGWTDRHCHHNPGSWPAAV